MSDGVVARWRGVLVPALPWVVAAVLALVALAPTASSTTPASDAGPDQSTAPVTLPSDLPDQPATAVAAAGRAPPEAASADPTELSASEEALVAGAARRVLGDVGLGATTGDPTGADRWALDLVVGPVVPLGPGVGTVTVHGTVVVAEDGGWSLPRPAAATVPVATTAGVRPAGPAWPTPASDHDEGATLHDDADAEPPADPLTTAALDALLDEGWRVDTVASARTVADGVVGLEVVGLAPGDDGAPRRWHPWIAVGPAP